MGEPLSAGRRAELRALEQDATPAPWGWIGDAWGGGIEAERELGINGVDPREGALIVAARNALVPLLDERDALAEEVATCHRLIARLDRMLDDLPPDPTVNNTLPPDEARVLDTVRAGGDEEKATP